MLEKKRTVEESAMKKMRSIALLALLSIFSILNFTKAQTTSGNLPGCKGTYNAKTWTNCVGEELIDSPPGYGKYIGQWKNGLRHGQGVFYFLKEGLTYSGEFKNGDINGVGTVTNKDGTSKNVQLVIHIYGGASASTPGNAAYVKGTEAKSLPNQQPASPQKEKNIQSNPLDGLSPKEGQAAIQAAMCAVAGLLTSRSTKVDKDGQKFGRQQFIDWMDILNHSQLNKDDVNKLMNFASTKVDENNRADMSGKCLSLSLKLKN